MAKRVAERELTQENWDQEDEEEEVVKRFKLKIAIFIFPPFEISTLPFSRDSRKSECFWCGRKHGRRADFVINELISDDNIPAGRTFQGRIQ